MALDIAWSADEKTPYGWVSGRGSNELKTNSTQPKPMRMGSGVFMFALLHAACVFQVSESIAKNCKA
jgi:hypothetical protein